MTQRLQQITTTKGLKTKSTQDYVVYAHIFDAILQQRLAPGTKLNEESLGDIFGVSRRVIRSVLYRLGLEQIVVLRPNRGAVVASPTVEEVRQIVIARRVVEKAVIELVIDNTQRAQIDRLTQLVKQEQKCFTRGDLGASIRQSGEFHILLAEMADNPPLLSFQRTLVSQCSLIIAQYESSTKSHCSYDQHFELIDSIKKHDKSKAVRLMMRHLDHIVHIEKKFKQDDEVAPEDLKVVFSNVLNQ